MPPEAKPAVLSPTSRFRLVLLALWAVFYGSFTLFSPPLLDDADSVHAEVAREMLLRYDFVTLYANGVRYLEKAPLYYWSMAASMKVFGASAAASRVPLALSVLALTLLLQAFARRAFYSERAGFYAGLIALSSFGIFIFSRINIPDVMVCVLLTAALYAFCRTELEERPKRRFAWMFAVAIALTLLTKGLIGIVFPVAIVAVHLLLTRGAKGAVARVRMLYPASSAAILLAIAVPWHVLAAVRNPSAGQPGAISFLHGHWVVPLPTEGNVHGWAWFYFVNEQLLRYLNLRVPRDYDTVPLPLFLGLIFVWLMPWSAFLPLALVRALPLHAASFRVALRTRSLDGAAKTRLLLVVWAAVPLVFFTFSTRQEYYVLPSLPPMVLLVASLLAESSHPMLTVFTRKSMGRTFLALAVSGGAAAMVCLYFILHTSAPVAGTDLASLLQQNPGDYALSFGHFLDLNARALGMFRVPLEIAVIAFGYCLPAAYGLRLLARRGRNEAGYAQASISLVATSAFLFLLAANLALVIFSPTLTSAQLADAIRPQLRPQDLLVLHGEYEAGSSLGFFLRRADLHIVEGRSSNLWYGSYFPDAPKIFETRESVAERWRGPQRIFLWEDPSDKDRPVLALPGPVYVVASSGGKRILSNQEKR